MSREDITKTRAADLSALVTRFEKKEITITDVVTKAYSMGHDDSTSAWNEANELIAKALGVIKVTLPKVEP
jgi:hypothetical protein